MAIGMAISPDIHRDRLYGN